MPPCPHTSCINIGISYYILNWRLQSSRLLVQSTPKQISLDDPNFYFIYKPQIAKGSQIWQFMQNPLHNSTSKWYKKTRICLVWVRTFFQRVTDLFAPFGTALSLSTSKSHSKSKTVLAGLGILTWIMLEFSSSSSNIISRCSIVTSFLFSSCNVKNLSYDYYSWIRN